MATVEYNDESVNVTSIPGSTGDDRITLNNTTVIGNAAYNAGGGSDFVSMQNSTLGGSGFGNTSISLGSAPAGGGETLVMKESSIHGNVSATGSDGEVHISLNDSTILGGGTNRAILSNSSVGTTIDISNGSSVGAISTGTGADSYNISDSTLSGLINDDTVANGSGADTIVIEDSTITASGAAIRLSGVGDQLTLSNTQATAAQVDLRTGTFTVDIRDGTKLDEITRQGNQPSTVSIDITDSTVRNLEMRSQTTSVGTTLNVTNSQIGNDDGSSGGAWFANGNDIVSVGGTSTISRQVFDLGGGNDSLIIGTDTRFSGSGTRGLEGSPGTDTLALNGSQNFTISLSAPATLEGGGTTTLLTRDNYDQVEGFRDGQINGTLSLQNSTSVTSDDTIRVTQFEKVELLCFVSGTMIATERGERPVESLCVGDLVQTADAGLQPVRWTASQRIGALDILLKKGLIPIRIKQGALGGEMPVRDLLVSPQHRMLVSGKVVERMFSVPQVLVAAKHLIAIEGIEAQSSLSEFEYVHFALSDHHIVYAEGAPSETLFAGEMAMRALDDGSRKELEEIFPGFNMPVSDFVMHPARLFVNGRQGRKLAERIVKNGYSLLDKFDGCVDLVKSQYA